MKKINSNTLLKCGNKTYRGAEINNVICWIDSSTLADEIVAQTSNLIQGIPVISLENYYGDIHESWNIVYRMFPQISLTLFSRIFKDGYNSNPNKDTVHDLVKAIDLSRQYPADVAGFRKEEILEELSQISVINVDEQFNILSYE
jgi:hypothetical protein